MKAPEPETLTLAYQTFSQHINNVELLIGSEGENFAFTGEVIEDLLTITSVHPMTEAAVRELLRKSNADWEIIHDLIERQLLKEIFFEGKKYYLRNWNGETRS